MLITDMKNLSSQVKPLSKPLYEVHLPLTLATQSITQCNPSERTRINPEPTPEIAHSHHPPHTVQEPLPLPTHAPR
jgi:hypothetical protein